MNEFATRFRASLWWTVPLLLALALVAWETNFGRAVRLLPPPEAPIPPRPVVTSLLPEFTISGGTSARTDTVQRTLFNPTRRPAPVLVADQAKQKLQRGQFALTGTMVVGGTNTAFLRENAGGRARRVMQGETINGLLVAEVKPDRVRLALGDESEELVLRVGTNPRPTVQPALPAPVPGAPVPGAPVPGAPVPGTPPPAAAAGSSTATAADASLAERRRAARAAQAAIQAQTSTPDGNPLPAQSAAPAAAPAPAAVAPAAPDPRWAEMYRQYQAPRQPNVAR